MKIRSVCLLGGTGFVGRPLAMHLARSGIAVTIPTRHAYRHRDLTVIPGLRLIEADILDAACLSALVRDVDGVINLAGASRAEGWTEASLRALHVELPGTLVKACEQGRAWRIIHMSAANADAVRGPSAYLRAKGQGEDQIHQDADGLAVTSVRPTPIFGPGDGLISRFAALLRRLPGPIPVPCAQTRLAPIYVRDLVEIIAGRLGDPDSVGQRIELCGPTSYTFKAMLELVATAMGQRRRTLVLSDGNSRRLAQLLEHVPGRPFTLDDYYTMQLDSLCMSTSVRAGTPLESILPQLIKPGTHPEERFAELRRRVRR